MGETWATWGTDLHLEIDVSGTRVRRRLEDALRDAGQAVRLAERAADITGKRDAKVLDVLAAAYADDDVDGVVALLTDDAWFTMPPVTLEFQGPAAIAAFLRDIAGWRGPRHYRLVPTRANGQPAFGCYLQDEQAGVFRAHGMIVLTLSGDRISAVTRFVDNSNMTRFGMPRMLA